MKLWIVERTYECMVLAENETDAIEFSEDAVCDQSDPDEFASEWSVGAPLAGGYDAACLVYHEGSEDISVKQAIEMVEEAAEPVRCPYTRELPL